MKPTGQRRFRDKLAAGEPVVGLWITLESASVTEMAVALGLDWVVVDAEHGHLDWKEINEHVRAAVRSDTLVLVRIAERSTSLAKRALDIGADGIVVPWVETARQLAQAVCDCRYPLEGRRGIGGERATVWGHCLDQHATEANQGVLVVPVIENVAAVPQISAMCDVDGAELFFFGPADFSASAGFRGQWEGPGVAEQIQKLKDVILGAGKHCGVIATSVEDLLRRRQEGFQMLCLGTDTGMLWRSLHQSLRAVGRDIAPATSLDPADGRILRDPLVRPPESMRPDRGEVITQVGQAEPVEVQAGVLFEPLAGAGSGARNLTTGIVTFSPSAALDYHTHPYSESLTVLEGQVEVAVEGRVHCLGPLDNIVIPRWIPHMARNPSSLVGSRLHVALASTALRRDIVAQMFTPKEMPRDSTGVAGGERVTRIQTAAWSRHIGPATQFVDFFNASLVPGIEMSGGYGRFEPGGHLPAHVHDFDESICIVEGLATCLVEGRRHGLRDCATAMIPRGRVHYFLNEGPSTMDMIWVYAGPRPERIVVDAACATEEGNPWR